MIHTLDRWLASSRRRGALRALLCLACALSLPGATDAAAMSDAEHRRIVAGLARGETVSASASGSLYWRVPQALVPQLPLEQAWYLHVGSSPLPIAELYSQITKRPNGDAPHSHQLLYDETVGGALVWKDKAASNLLEPALLAMFPRAFKKHVYWDPLCGRSSSRNGLQWHCHRLSPMLCRPKTHDPFVGRRGTSVDHQQSAVFA